MRTFLSLVFCLACTSGGTTDPDGPDEPELETLEEALDQAVGTPPELLVFGQDYPSRPAPTLEETRSELFAGGEPGPLLSALVEAGMDQDEAVEVVFAAAAHNSGQDYDPVRQRANEWRRVYRNAVEEFRAELAAASEETGIAYSDEELSERGIILGWGDL
ncbi:MAG: hypothetical protein AAGE52_11135 [Myxococcota bacterium]